MTARRVFAVVMLACLAAPATARDEKPDAKTPRGIDRATAAAWAKRGFKTGWMREIDGRVVLTPEYPKEGDAIPAAWYAYLERDPTDDDLKDLPAVNVPFALSLAGGGKFTDAGLEHLGSLANLAWLDVGPSAITGEGLKPLAGLKHLSTLKIQHSGQMTDAGAKHLAAFKQLTRLSLHNTPLGDDGLKELAGLTNLTVLDLNSTKVTDAGLKHIAGLTKLTDLNLSSTGVTDDGLAHLAGLTNLRTLNLWLADVDGTNLKPLAGKKLTTLGIEGIKLTDESFRTLGEMGLLHALTAADFYVYGPTDRSVEGGKRPTKPEEVRTFRLYARHATGEAVKYLAAFPNLEHLSLGTEQVTPEGLKHAANLKNVTDLTLESTQHAGDGLKHLAGMTKLTHLHVGGTELTREDVKRLTALKTLTHLSLRITDETIRTLHECGSLHLLWGAKGADGKRAATDDEIVSLDLSFNNTMKGEGLKYIAKLKNIATVDLRHTPVTKTWLEDFQRTRPKCVVIRK